MFIDVVRPLPGNIVREDNEPDVFGMGIPIEGPMSYYMFEKMEKMGEKITRPFGLQQKKGASVDLLCFVERRLNEKLR